MSATTPHRHGDTEKHPFDIDLAMARIREAVRPFPPAALFALADEGFYSPFELLMAWIIFIRTYDEVILPCVKRLFALASNPMAVSQLTPRRSTPLSVPRPFMMQKPDRSMTSLAV